MNIELYIGTKALYLGSNVRVSFQRENNFWREDVSFTTEYSLPFDIPYSPANAAILGFAENINSPLPVPGIATLKIQGNTRYVGTLVILQSSLDGYNIALVRNIDFDFSKKLSDVCTETFDNPDPETDMPDQIALGVLNPFNWPQIANFNPAEVEKYKLHELWDLTYLNYYHGTGEYFATDAPASPQFFLSYIIRSINNYYKLNLTTNWLDHPQVNNKMVFNSNTITGQPAYDRFIKMQISSNKNVEIYIQVLTLNEWGDLVDYRPYQGDTINISIYRFAPGSTTLAATYTIAYVVQAGDIGDCDTFFTNIASAFQALDANFVLDSKSIDQDNPTLCLTYVVAGVYHQLRITNTFANYATKRDISISPTGYSFFISDINMANHMPDMTVAEFLSAIKDAYNLAIYFNFSTNSTVIEAKKDLLQFGWVDVTKYLLANPVITPRPAPDYNIKYQAEEYAVQQKLYDYSDGQVTANPNYTKGSATAVPIALGWLYAPYTGLRNGNAGSFLLPGTGIMPCTEQAIGNYTELVANPLRLITWQGMDTDTDGNDYPRADMEDLEANELYNTWWAPWLTYKNSDPRQVDCKLRIPPATLNIIDPRHRWRINGIDHIWITITETYNHNDVEVTASLARM